MDVQVQVQAAACQSISSSFPGVSLFGTGTGLFFFLAVAGIVYCCYCIVVAILTTNRSTSNKGNKGNPPPGRGSRNNCWCWWWSVAVETLSFVAANSSGRGFYHFVQARHRRYGAPCFRTALFGHTHVFVNSPDAARSLLAAEPAGGRRRCFSKRYVRTVSDLLGEHSLLCASSYAGHRALRRAIAPLFNAHTTASFAATFDALTRRLIMRDWMAAATTTATSSTSPSSSAVVVLDAALGITFEAICDMLVATLQPDTRRQLQSDVLTVTRAMLAFPLSWLPGTRFYQGLQARKRIMEVLRQEIASRRLRIDMASMKEEEEEDDDDDFLQTLLLRQQSASSEASSSFVFLTDEQILDNILTLIIAGQVTTATAITWMVKYLADNTDFQENLRSVQLELALKQQVDADTPLTLQHLNSMELAYMTVKESLRMASIVSWFPRVALEDCQVAGFDINKGWIVNIDARALHYDATLYDNPTMFDPWRFKATTTTKQRPPYSFLVFGAGGRTCLGMNLAKIMMLIFLHHLVTTWRWEMADEDQSLEKWAMFPRLKSGCPIHLTPI